MNHMKNIIPSFVATILVCIFLVYAPSCTKEKKTPAFNYEDQRIASITERSNNQTATFSYDEQKRLSRIDYSYDGNPSLRFEYTLPTITAQYYKGAAPDITREKYVFTTLNGKVVNIRMTNPDGTSYDTYLGYDASERITEIGVRGISNNGSTLFFSLDAYFSYPQNNIQQVKVYGTRGSATDSVTFVRTYELQNRYFDFTNIGFNYFGIYSTGIAYKVSGLNHVIAPFPFFTSKPFSSTFAVTRGMIPTSHPLKSLTGEGRIRDLLDFSNNGWQYVSWHSEFDDTYYKYDEKGRLSDEGGLYLFTWQ